jgi:hypothetical protein
MLSQNMRSIPKALRSNVSLWWVSRFEGKKQQNDIYEELGGTLREDRFYALYDYSTLQPHGALVIDYSKDRQHQFCANFKEYITFSSR